MANITCGKCKQTHASVVEVKACFGTQAPAVAPVPAEAYEPGYKMVTVPDSKYALVQNGVTKFYEVRSPKKGRWAGFTFVDLLVGAPGSFVKYPVKGALRKSILAALAEDPKAAAVRFSHEFTVCACCGSPLTDPESLAAGLGPVCAGRFAA